MDTTEPARTTTTAGTLTLTVWPDTPLGVHQRYAYRIYDTQSGAEVEGRDLFTGAGTPANPDWALRELATYLGAEGGARQYELDNPGQRSEHAGLFPEAIAEAARRNADELADLTAGGPQTPQSEQAASVAKWISVVFLQGEQADTVLELIDRDGTDAAIEHLAGYDYGDETVQAALENGYVYDSPPAGTLDRVATRDVYVLTYNPFFGHVSLLREHDAMPDPVLLGIEDPTPVRPNPQRTGVAVDPSDWFTAPTTATSSHRVGPGL